MEGNVVKMGLHGESIGAHLVGEITVHGDAVGAHQHSCHAAITHQDRSHAIGDERVWDVELFQLPCRESRALKQRAGFIHEDMDALVLQMSLMNHAERRAHTHGGKATGIAMGEQGLAALDERGAMFRHALAKQHVLQENMFGLKHQIILGAAPLQYMPQAVQGPHQIHRRGSRPAQPQRIALELCVGGARLGDASQAQGRRHAQQWRTAHFQFLDGLHHGAWLGDIHPDFSARQKGLVEDGEPLAVKTQGKGVQGSHRILGPCLARRSRSAASSSRGNAESPPRPMADFRIWQTCSSLSMPL